MRRVGLGVFLVLCVLSVGTVAGQISLNITDSVVYYSPTVSEMDMELVITSQEFIDPLSELSIYIDSVLEDSLIVSNFASGGQSYRDNPFSFNLVSTGTREWDVYQRVNFTYILSASGLCCTNETEGGMGLCECDVSGGTCEPINPPENYPCAWSISQQYGDNSYVTGDDGLKFIVQSGIFGPESRDDTTTVWAVNIIDSDASVTGTMRAACGTIETGQSKYMGLYLDDNGWAYVTKHRDDFQYINGTAADYRVHIGVPFDDSSMVPGFTAYGGPSLSTALPTGGVYKDGVIVSQLGKVELNGTTGYVTIREFSGDDSNYDFVFLPPNGNHFCAYTPEKTSLDSDWEVTSEIANVSTRYDNVYTGFFEESVIESLLTIPNCPQDSFNCVRTRETVSAAETYDPNNAITVTYDYATDITVYGNVTEQVFDDFYSERLTMNYSLPSGKTPHQISVSLVSGGETYGATQTFYICQDSDNDGYCNQTGDCNDTSISVNPGATEICNGLDDNCNGDIDEAFWGQGKIGQGCLDWPGSRCVGTLVCSDDGNNVTCKPNQGYYFQGQLKELCSNGKDDDCDGEIDESYDVSSGLKACVDEDDWCETGQTRPCNNKGICATNPGTMVCVNGKWGDCKGGKSPETEVCNNKDDDCDGFIDNLNGEIEVDDTKCWCTSSESDKKTPKSVEECNDVDDDCDGRIDEGATGCCLAGQTRVCGETEGVCKLGIQRCDSGQWGICEGALEPNPEGDICCNDKDDDCNGMIDEYCSEEVCNQAGQAAFIYWLIIGFGIIMVIVALMIYQFRDRLFATTQTEVAVGAVPKGTLNRLFYKIKKLIMDIIDKIKKMLGMGKKPQQSQQQPQARQQGYDYSKGY